MMIAHLDIPAMDASEVPSTLSKKIVTGILQDSLGFEGLIVTDAMNMKGVTKGHETGVVDKDALVAGNDMIEFTEDLGKAILEVKKAIKNGQLSQKTIDARCRKILALKQWVGLDHYSPISAQDIDKDLHSATAELLQRKLVEQSLTVLRNENNLIPVRRLDTLKIASISIGAAGERTTFQHYLGMYATVADFHITASAKADEIQKLRDTLKGYDLIMVGIHDSSIRPGNSIQFNQEVKGFISELSVKKNSIITLFKNPYTIAGFDNMEKASVLIEAYQDSPLSQEMAAQLIFGGIGASGRLPVSVGDKFKAGDGLDITGGIRFTYTLPEDAGMDSHILIPKVDSIMQQAIDDKAIPGGQILVAHNQKVVLYKAYGLHEYNDTIKVKKNDLYDLASVTKISSALPILMQLSDEGKFDLQKGIDDYLPYFRHSNKAGIPFRQILTHQARFEPWIAYWKNTLRKNGSYKWNTFKKDSSRRYPIKIADDMWLHRHYKKKIFKAIKKSPLLKEAKYTYSGLAFYLLPTIVEKITDSNFVDYLNDHFYDKLGATTLTYKPMKKFNIDRIIPTESDFNFRHREIHGMVHDEGAIMMGGVSGNAGLFADANDIAKLMQMYLNMGEYGGERFIKASTLKEWSTTQFPDNDNRRGIGFDKPNLEYIGPDNNAAKDASAASFGHTGFTGIMVWMDPKEDLLYIFMSNRVLPTRENTRLYSMNTRTQIQQVLYDAIID